MQSGHVGMLRCQVLLPAPYHLGTSPGCSGQVARDQEMQEIAAIHLFNIPSSGLIQLLYKQAPADLNKIFIWGYQ